MFFNRPQPYRQLCFSACLDWGLVEHVPDILGRSWISGLNSTKPFDYNIRVVYFWLDTGHKTNIVVRVLVFQLFKLLLHRAKLLS